MIQRFRATWPSARDEALTPRDSALTPSDGVLAPASDSLLPTRRVAPPLRWQFVIFIDFASPTAQNGPLRKGPPAARDGALAPMHGALPQGHEGVAPRDRALPPDDDPDAPSEGVVPPNDSASSLLRCFLSQRQRAASRRQRAPSPRHFFRECIRRSASPTLRLPHVQAIPAPRDGQRPASRTFLLAASALFVLPRSGDVSPFPESASFEASPDAAPWGPARRDRTAGGGAGDVLFADRSALALLPRRPRCL